MNVLIKLHFPDGSYTVIKTSDKFGLDSKGKTKDLPNEVKRLANAVAGRRRYKFYEWSVLK